MEIGKLIKELRTKKGITQEELAHQTEVSTRTIQRIENGDVDPRAYTLQMIAKALEVDYSMFVETSSEESTAVQEVNDNNWIALLHLSSIIPLVFPSILIWNAKKNVVNGMHKHYKEVMSLQLMVLGVTLGCLWVYWKTNIIMPLVGVLLANALFAIFRALNTFSDKEKAMVNDNNS
ncbi:helix-turn-helix domain-containing protein [Carboxylicivirga marina]|uniref:Helix-turn-helix domain-containing protein n=1 Tax=Carboxylicivirga marina TaxID=2800988 RepID=A0ABS1HHZ8_9BACT|nr:helix-turn-helix domain-containing protein [Carboxylicivirga marina]MBK3517177.1 helix-turn-helix domain-containing protein [Carboxylicivirga marina]